MVQKGYLYYQDQEDHCLELCFLLENHLAHIEIILIMFSLKTKELIFEIFLLVDNDQ